MGRCGAAIWPRLWGSPPLCAPQRLRALARTALAAPTAMSGRAVPPGRRASCLDHSVLQPDASRAAALQTIRGFLSSACVVSRRWNLQLPELHAAMLRIDALLSCSAPTDRPASPPFPSLPASPARYMSGLDLGALAWHSAALTSVESSRMRCGPAAGHGLLELGSSGHGVVHPTVLYSNSRFDFGEKEMEDWEQSWFPEVANDKGFDLHEKAGDRHFDAHLGDKGFDFR